ncbi:MAG: hypothetical protein QGI86_03745 [Candidatus Poribacteria bacterium]|nr:hypothetical protein [Candidatus Poribacteria bacterium]
MLNSNPSLNDMNNLNKISKWLCLLPFLSLLVSLPSQSEEVRLGPKLRQKVNLKIGEVEDYQPQTADLTPINRLDLKGLGAADGPATLEGLDRLGNLTELELSDSHLESSTHLKDLRKLKIFKFSRGKINSLKPDANQLRSRINTFTALEECELRGNDLDVSFLNGLDLPQLTDLDLSENQLANVNSIGGGNLSKLKRLNLSQNPLQRQQAGAPVLKALLLLPCLLMVSAMNMIPSKVYAKMLYRSSST